MIAVADSLAIEEAAAALGREIQSINPAVSCQFIVHRRGQRRDALQTVLSRLGSHPAAEATRELLKTRTATSEISAFIGIAAGYERGFLSRKGTMRCLGFIGLNVDQYDSREQALYALYSLTSQYLDMAGLVTAKTIEEHGDILILPKRSTLVMARSNMKADIFSVLMMQSQGTDHPARHLAQIRAMEALTCQLSHNPEVYPFAISLDVTEFAAKKAKSLPASRLSRSLHELSTEVIRTFDRQNLENWVNFTAPAQKMAWGGCSPEQILGAAIHTSPNPFIKSIGNLLSEITAIDPVAKEAIRNEYNPFVDGEINQISHERQVEDTFEMVMIHSMEADSSLPLSQVANNQNESITRGRVIGWCSHALQSAAKAYDNAMARGTPAMQAARLEFESAKHQTNWESLNRLNQYILEQKRHGYPVTLSDVAAWCKNHMDLRPVMESINYTLADPAYARKLEAAAEMPMPVAALAPQASAPTYTPPAHVPQFSPGMAGGMGGMGGLSGGMVALPQRPPVKQGTEDDQHE